ncbi:MAG TPA: sulfate adenylyltransferase subunit CysN [Kofleriaceae bacterium]|nr:sulfate adenylyltransferase subunit CysN [Kofleriaceae bacterium]
MYLAEQEHIARDVEGYLRRHEHKELLRLVVIGSVDDGKSTLIGRLLHDSGRVYDDHLSAVQRASARGATRGQGSTATIDLSLLTDGLKAEREQGITIDVAYRYFATEKRKFIIADTPGHVQYTRNMATGASTADVAVILIDARLGVLPQTRRHAYIAALLGIPHLVVCINKMDLVGWDRDVYGGIAGAIEDHGRRLGIPDVRCLPVSALDGDQVVRRGAAATWYDGPTLLEHLESVPLATDAGLPELRFPVQYVIRPSLDYRGFAGQIASGVVRTGDEVVSLPSGKSSKVVAIDTFEGPIDEAFAPMSVTLRLADEIDVSRGDMLVHGGARPVVSDRIDARVVWMTEKPLDPTRTYVLKHTTRAARVDVERIEGVIDPETLAVKPAARLELNDIGRLTLRSHTPLFVDAYAASRSTGAFILIDALTNDTVAAGMIEPHRADAAPTEAIDRVTAADRRARLGQGGAVVEIGGRDALELAYRLERSLFEHGRVAAVVAAEHATAFAGVALIAIVPRSDLPDGVTLDGAPVDGDPLAAVLQSAGRIDAARADHR